MKRILAVITGLIFALTGLWPQALNTVEAPYIIADTAFQGPGSGITGFAPGLTTGDSAAVFSALASTAPGQGDSLVASQSILAGSIARTQHSKNGDSVSLLDFGAIGDGASHPLSGVTSLGANNTTGWSLAQWQAIYPCATSLTNELDWCALTTGSASCIAAAQALVVPAGSYQINLPFTLNQNCRIIGSGNQQTAFLCTGTDNFISNQAQVNDFVQISDIKIKNVSSSAYNGLDIGTVRHSTFTNLSVQLFTTQYAIWVNVNGIANWYNRFYNCEAWGSGSTGTGFYLGNSGISTPPDLDYNDFYGCSSYSLSVGIQIENAISCQIHGHQVTSCTTALVIVSGNNNIISLNAELTTNMGSAASGTLSNTLSLYNDGLLATPFVDNGTNLIQCQTLGNQVLPNPYRAIDCSIIDRLSFGSTAASFPLFHINMTDREFSGTVTVMSSGLIQGQTEFATVQVWDVVMSAGGTPVVTLVRTNATGSLGSGGTVSATASSGKVQWTIAGNVSFTLLAQVVVKIEGVGAHNLVPYMQPLGYVRG